MCILALRVIFGKPRYLHPSRKNSEANISIIIPARNEADNIASLLDSINAQDSTAHEIIVVNDSSTDQTASIAKNLGAKVIDARPLPDGWKGKPWACEQGAEVASGSWLLFLDADTFMVSETFLSQLSSLTNHENHVFSICPWHQIRNPYEELSIFFNLLMVIGIDAFNNNQSPENDTRLVGQSMLISKINYAQCGGHSVVKSEILENYHLSKTLKEKGIQRTCYLGKNYLHMRMFPGGFMELWRSWKKGFTSGAATVSPNIITWISIWITGMIIAPVSVIVALTIYPTPLFLALSLSAYCLHAFACYRASRAVGSFSIINTLFYPVSLVFYHVLFFSALIDQKRGKQVSWKGRDVS